MKKLYFFLFLIMLALPLANLPPWFSPPAWGKTIVLRSMLALVLVLFFLKNKISFRQIKNSKLFLPFTFLAIFVGFTFLSLLASPNISHSLWGDPSRAGGYINYLFYIIFALIIFFLAKEKQWKKLLNFSLIIGFLVGLIGIFQKFELFEQFLIFGRRPSSTMGNPGILSLFLVPVFFLALTFFVKEKNKILKFIYLLLSGYFAYVIVFITATRAAFLGLAFGFVWFLLAFPLKKKKLKIGLIAILLLFLGSFAYLYQNQAYQDWPDTFKRPISRIMNLTEGQARISAWRISLRAFQEKPFLGYGPENYDQAFNKHYDPTLPSMEKAAWFNRGHNSLIDILIQYGIFSLIFYLLFFFSILYYLYRNKNINSHGIQTALIAFFITSFFSIESFSTFLIFFFLLGYSFYLIDQQNYLIKREKPFFSYALILLFLFFLFGYNTNVFQQNTKINLAKENPEKGLKVLEQEREKKTFLIPYLNTQYVILLDGKDPEKAIELLSENVEKQPNKSRNWSYLGKYLLKIGEKKEAQKAFNQAWQLKPKSPSLILESTMADLNIDKIESTEKKTEYCFQHLKDFKECYWLSALLNIHKNELEKGKQDLEKVKELGYPIKKERALSQLITAYKKNDHFEEIAQTYKKLIELNPDPQYQASLAFTYKELGEFKKARKLAQEILKEHPEQKPAIEQFLESF